MKKLTFENMMHGKKVNVIPHNNTDENEVSWYFITPSQIKRIRRVLCGVKGCECRIVQRIIDKEKITCLENDLFNQIAEWRTGDTGLYI
jgi:hypothetical protein